MSDSAVKLDYETLQAHGLREPKLVEHAAFMVAPPAVQARSPEPEGLGVQLVKNEAGRWELQRALGESEPPPAALKRPGADEAAAVRKRKARAHVCVPQLALSSALPLACSSRRRWRRACLRLGACLTCVALLAQLTPRRRRRPLRAPP